MFSDDEAPRYMTAVKGLIGVYVGVIVFAVCLAVVMMLENWKRDREAREKGLMEVVEKEGDEKGFEDRTDFENRGFRYKW